MYDYNLDHQQAKPLSTCLLILVMSALVKGELFDEMNNENMEIPVRPHIVKYDVSGSPYTIKLQCNLLQDIFKKHKKIGINELRWEHKKCGYGLNLKNCAESTRLPWAPVTCKNGSKFCDGHTLKLENPRTTESGYYRCLYKNYLSKQFRVYKIFHVDIYDPAANIEILTEPLESDNPILLVNSTVTFRCRARSLFPLHMMWAKVIFGERKVDRPIRHDFNTYELIKNEGCFYSGDDVYVSKLTLNTSQISNSGKYYCIVINLNNAVVMKNKSVVLTIVPRMTNASHFVKSSIIIQMMFGFWNYLLWTASFSIVI